MSNILQIFEAIPLAENGEEDQVKAKKQGLTQWLKAKIFGKEQKGELSDTQSLEDLSEFKSVGRYEIIGKLGQGSMGVVYRGRDPYIGRDVGVKIARPSASVAAKGIEKFREKFFREAQSAGRLLHPNIVAVYDAGMYKDFYYITMEYVDGPSLRRYCKKNLLPLSRVVEVMFMVCKGLDYAHKMDILHRDIKPSNILLTKSGVAKIADFSIAQIKSEQTVSKGIVGSPSYMSPEQVKEEPLDDRSDIFSLGSVLYELLTGKRAFPGDNYFSIVYKISNEEPVPIREIRQDVPEVLERIVKKAHAKDRTERYQTCMDLAYDLRVALRGINGGTRDGKVDDVIDYALNVPFFENFSKDQVSELLNTGNIIKVPKGNVMVTEGELDDSFYIILSGSAVVWKEDKIIARIGRGECFGEMSYLSGQTRAATVSADTDCILLKVSATLLDKSPESMQVLFLKNFAQAVIRRLSIKI
jgi:serine/threonine protein kinase